MRTSAEWRFLLFKLSDLGLWKSFPRYLLKRGFEITLHLNNEHFALNSDPTIGVPAAGQVHTTLKGLKALDNAGPKYDRWVLHDCKMITRYTEPD